ncbi:MAG: hypothetical protein ACRC5M_04325 [Anaeroplasmataceae bacterium]
MANEIIKSSPYADDADDRQGRVAIISTDEEWFNKNTTENPGGADASVPYAGEFAHSKDGDFVVLTRDENNKVVPISASRDLRKRFEKLEDENVFKNAEAFVFNSAVNTVYYDIDRMTVKISAERVFSTNYKYWAIRGVRVEDGKPMYYTGILDSDGSGNILSNMINTDSVFNDAGELVGVTCSGHLVVPLEHAHNYLVQFFDSEGMVIEQLPFQAYSVRNMTFDTVPENGIVSVKFATTGSTINLFRGSSWNDLGLRVIISFSDGSARDVTSEWTSTNGTIGRVKVEGLEDIDSNILTPDGEAGYPVKLSYYVTTTNIDNPLFDPDTLSISSEYNVRIIPNNDDEVLFMWPTMWIDGPIDASSKSRVCFKIFTLNITSKRDTYLCDQTYKIRSLRHSYEFFGAEDGDVTNETDPERIFYDFEYSTFAKTLTHNIPVYSGENKIIKYQFKSKSEYNENRIVQFSYPRINSAGNDDFYTTYYLEKFNDSKMNSRLKFVSHLGANTTYLNNLNDLIETNTLTLGSEVRAPTHIKIRNGRVPTTWHLNTAIPLDTSLYSQGFFYNQYADSYEFVTTGTPVIVEFIQRVTNEITGMVTSNITSIRTFFVKEISSSDE